MLNQSAAKVGFKGLIYLINLTNIKYHSKQHRSWINKKTH